MTEEMKEALEIAERWKGESAATFGPNKTLGILSRALLESRRGAIEECAVVADAVWISANSVCRSKCAGSIAKAIRALKVA